MRAIHARPRPPSEAQRSALPGAIRRLRGQGPVDASIVIPLNAQADMDHLAALLVDLARYEGPHRLEVIVVLNNYRAGDPPPYRAWLESLNLTVVAIPSVRRPGEAVSFTARMPGLRVAASETSIHFDADCRLPDPDTLIDWYVASLRWAGAAYGPVLFHSVPPGFAAEAAVAVHHGTRWAKRVLLRLPTLRGSAYAARRSPMLEAYRAGVLADDLNVGPAIRAMGMPVVHGTDRRLVVRTSGRMYGFTWPQLARYLRYRFSYNLRVIPVRRDAAAHTGRERHPVRQYVDDRPVAVR